MAKYILEKLPSPYYQYPLLRQNYNLQFEPSADKAGRLESCSICSGEGDMEKEEEEVP